MLEETCVREGKFNPSVTLISGILFALRDFYTVYKTTCLWSELRMKYLHWDGGYLASHSIHTQVFLTGAVPRGVATRLEGFQWPPQSERIVHFTHLNFLLLLHQHWRQYLLDLCNLRLCVTCSQKSLLFPRFVWSLNLTILRAPTFVHWEMLNFIRI